MSLMRFHKTRLRRVRWTTQNTAQWILRCCQSEIVSDVSTAVLAQVALDARGREDETALFGNLELTSTPRALSLLFHLSKDAVWLKRSSCAREGGGVGHMKIEYFSTSESLPQGTLTRFDLRILCLTDFHSTSPRETLQSQQTSLFSMSTMIVFLSVLIAAFFGAIIDARPAATIPTNIILNDYKTRCSVCRIKASSHNQALLTFQ